MISPLRLQAGNILLPETQVRPSRDKNKETYHVKEPQHMHTNTILQRYSLFSAKVPLFGPLLPPQLNREETLSEETQSEFDAKKTVNVSDIHLIWRTQTDEDSYKLHTHF